MFMNSYVWSAKCIADKMTVNSKKINYSCWFYLWKGRTKYI